jgi:GAF domain-containing protein
MLHKLSEGESSHRIKELLSYEIMDTDLEKPFQDLVDLASRLLDCPISLVSLLDDKRQWFKAMKGISVRETPIEYAFCNYALKNQRLFEVEDATKSEVFKNNPLVTGEPFIKFYAGFPLKNQNDAILGTLCVIDSEPRKLSKRDREILEILAKQAMELLEKHRMSKDLSLYRTFITESVFNFNDIFSSIEFLHIDFFSSPL